MQSPDQLAALRRLLKAPPPMDQTVPLGQHEVPDWSHVAPPVHLPVEKDRIRLQVNIFFSVPSRSPPPPPPPPPPPRGTVFVEK